MDLTEGYHGVIPLLRVPKNPGGVPADRHYLSRATQTFTHIQKGNKLTHNLNKNNNINPQSILTFLLSILSIVTSI